MNYPKDYYVKTPIVGDKVWLDVAHFFNVKKKAFHGPWWIVAVHSHGVKLRREKGPGAIVSPSVLLRMPKGQIKKMAVLPSHSA